MVSPHREDIRKQPKFSCEDAARVASREFGIEGRISELPSERDQNFRIETRYGDYVLKIANHDADVRFLELENQAIRLVQATDGFHSPQISKSTSGPSIARFADDSGSIWHARCLSYVPGIPLARIENPADRLLTEIGQALAKLDRTLFALNQVPAAKRNFAWDLKLAPQIVADLINTVGDRNKQALLQLFLGHYREIESRIGQLPESVIHNDVNDYNILVHTNKLGDMELGIIDFGDMLFSTTINDLAICLAYVMLDKPDPLAAATRVTVGYHAIRKLSEQELSVLFPLACMRLCQSVCLAVEQKRLRPGDEYLAISETPAWQLLGRLAEVDPRDARKQFSEACRESQVTIDEDMLPRQVSAGEILAGRKKRLGPSLSLAYERPLHIIRGRGQYLFDASDLTYLDCVNNVCHVGHCHPKVVEAAARQLAILNTNTRYLHENIVALADRLTAKMPAPLEVCYFVNSGSEANDLALRLARTFTGHRDCVVINHAYHGHVSSLIELSPYKFNGPGGAGKPPHVHVVPMPDGFRGEYRTSDRDCGRKYAATAKLVIDEAVASGRMIAGFFAEPILGCGGQVPLPDGYLAEVFSEIRRHGGVCIADEVQVGFGRIGTHFWGFEKHAVVPDIVTMGKPMGNGHPLAAVVTTREIADAFDNGMEYFNTFGGNPVSCAIGLAVLDVLEKEELQQHALEQGQWLLEHLERLKREHSTIGDVRGSGLFLGIELITDPDSLQPATELARKVINRMRQHCILLSTDGPDDNVIKFKPPMVFNQADAERLVMMLDQVLSEVG
jgi:4-aminobutyrate aminotransferase-like enzyme/Ser/Thr protein kinase RdoA (MazF antagonist)